MAASRFQQLTALFERACALDPTEHDAFLDDVCATDPDLRAELVRMLAVERDAPRFLDRPEVPVAPTLPDTPDRIGPYRIARTIGTGGMGVVYEAQQDNPVRRVALKMLRFGFDTESHAGRFRYEVEVLARLSHPGIAKVYEAGVHTGSGGVEVPYFAMEFVEGATDLVTYAQREQLSLDRRVELFLAVCDAVRHGHQLGVVHRDLKPANVLVGADGRPKVIDFGVARAVGDGDARTQATRTGEIIGTLTRMSPEQLVGDPELVDTRADVYALGLLLYELLCGRLPYDVEGHPWPEVWRIIRDEPARDPSRLNPEVPRDLGWIALRALEKERERRYASVSELIAELERYQSHVPVLAGPPSGVYRARKFIERNRLAVGAASIVVVSLLAGTALATIGMLKARDSEALAKEDAARARAMRDLTTGVFESVRDYGFGADARMVDVLRAAAFESDQISDQPSVNLKYRLLLGDTFALLGEYGVASDQFERALEAGRESSGADSMLIMHLQLGMATALIGKGEREEASRILGDLIERNEETFGPDSAETVRARMVEATGLLRPGSEERLQAFQRLTPLAMSHLGAEDPRVTALAMNLCFEFADRHRYEEALAMANEVIEALEREVAAEHPRLLFARMDRGILRRLNGDLEGCETEFDAIAPALQLRLGTQSLRTGDLMLELAKVKRFLDHHEEAEAIVRRELALRLPLTGDDGEHTSTLLFELGELLLEREEYEEAEECYWRAIDGSSAVFGESDIRTLVARAALARLWYLTERQEDAVAMLQEVVEETAGAYGDDSRMLVEFLVMLAEFTGPSAPEQALPHATRATRIARANLPPATSARTDALDIEARMLLETGDPAAAEPLLLELLDTLPGIAATDELRRDTAESLAKIYEDRGDQRSATRYRALIGAD